jgi:hypothetical protein
VTNTNERVRELFKDRPEPSSLPARERKNFRKYKPETEGNAEPAVPEADKPDSDQEE